MRKKETRVSRTTVRHIRIGNAPQEVFVKYERKEELIISETSSASAAIPDLLTAIWLFFKMDK